MPDGSAVMQYSAMSKIGGKPNILSAAAPWMAPAALGVGVIGGALDSFLGASDREDQLKEAKRQARFNEMMRLREMNMAEQQYREAAGMRGFQTANQAFPAINASADWRERLLRMRA